MWEFNKKYLLLPLILLFVTIACKREEKQYVYSVNSVDVSQAGTEKPYVKTSSEYISIAYTDIFGENIPNKKLEELKMVYKSFGDVGVTEDLIIRNFLNDEAADLPDETFMQENPDEFVIEAYKKVFNRVPNELELWYLKDCIENDSALTPHVIYYALMTSNEYRQF